ncbi:hypothetical protein VNO78_23110 [Psophocarpus tetragonolobus]|uniref:Uncharacterized protein n=1 Tax=Psophocarpus tetragonolobus TaxID=3891 RepID=A0AAN9S3F0_PSOTE
MNDVEAQALKYYFPLGSDSESRTPIPMYFEDERDQKGEWWENWERLSKMRPGEKHKGCDFCSQFHFQLGSCVSIYGCFHKHHKIDNKIVNCADLDIEQGTFVALTLDGALELPNLYKNSNAYEALHTHDTAGV